MYLITNYVDTFKNYVGFSGIATRKQYWMFVLANFIVTIIMFVIDIGVLRSELLSTLYSLAVMLPSLAIAVRRLRDAGFSWAWIFINMIPVIGWIVFIVLLCMKSKTTVTPTVSVTDAPVTATTIPVANTSVAATTTPVATTTPEGQQMQA